METEIRGRFTTEISLPISWKIDLSLLCDEGESDGTPHLSSRIICSPPQHRRSRHSTHLRSPTSTRARSPTLHKSCTRVSAIAVMSPARRQVPDFSRAATPNTRTRTQRRNGSC